MPSAAGSVSWLAPDHSGSAAEVRISRLAEHHTQLARAATARITAAPTDPPPTRPRLPSRRELRGLLVTVLEVLDRRRPASQLAALFPIAECRELCRDTTRPGPRRLRSMRVSTPVPETIELCATVDHAGRVRALVARLELAGDQWACVLVRLL